MRTIAEGALMHERILVATALDAASSSVLEAAVATGSLGRPSVGGPT